MNTIRNSVHLIGRLGRDIALKEVAPGRSLARITLATNETYKNTKGENVTETQWHNLIVWGKNAERMEQLLKKGDELAIQGKLVHRSYEDTEGNKRYASEVRVNEFVKIGNKRQQQPV